MSYGHDKDFVVKDSGRRIDYQSGMRRDTQEGKPNYRLIDLGFLRRLATHLTKGAEKYGRDNWRLANSKEELDRFQDSAFRHLMQWLNGETDEDHGMAVAFNIMAAEHTKEKMAEIMPKEKPAVPPYSDEKEGVNIYSFLRTLNDVLPGEPIITFAIDFDYDWLTIYIKWQKFKLSRKIDLLMFRHIYTEERLIKAMVEDICHNYLDAMKSQKGDKDEHPVAVHTGKNFGTQPKPPIDIDLYRIMKDIDRLVVDKPQVTLELRSGGEILVFSFLWPRHLVRHMMHYYELANLNDVKNAIYGMVITVNGQYLDAKVIDAQNAIRKGNHVSHD